MKHQTHFEKYAEAYVTSFVSVIVVTIFMAIFVDIVPKYFALIALGLGLLIIILTWLHLKIDLLFN